jgi:hypothetical protein
MNEAASIRITTKALSSGNCQVKFFIEDEKNPQYGYLLMHETKSIGDILEEIKVRMARRRESLLQSNPFISIAPSQDDHHFYLFSA